jgi:hypothetical protein
VKTEKVVNILDKQVFKIQEETGCYLFSVELRKLKYSEASPAGVKERRNTGVCRYYVKHIVWKQHADF